MTIHQWARCLSVFCMALMFAAGLWSSAVVLILLPVIGAAAGAGALLREVTIAKEAVHDGR